MAFNLSSLPDTQGKTVELRVKVKTFEGDKTFVVKYNSDKTELYKTELQKDTSGVSNMADMN